MPKLIKQLSINAQVKRYLSRSDVAVHEKWINDKLRKAFKAGYSAARRDPMVINGITEPARWAECARWCDAIQAVCPNKHPNGKLGTTRDIATFIAAAFNLEQPSLPNMTANDS